MQRGVALVAVEMQRLAAGEIEIGKRVEKAIVAGADDRAFSIVGEDERERRALYPARMYGDIVGARHVEKHAAEPIVGDGRDEVRGEAELGAGESGSDR